MGTKSNEELKNDFEGYLKEGKIITIEDKKYQFCDYEYTPIMYESRIVDKYGGIIYSSEEEIRLKAKLKPIDGGKEISISVIELIVPFQKEKFGVI
jgi:hypothetical protein